MIPNEPVTEVDIQAFTEDFVGGEPQFAANVPPWSRSTSLVVASVVQNAVTSRFQTDWRGRQPRVGWLWDEVGPSKPNLVRRLVGLHRCATVSEEPECVD